MDLQDYKTGDQMRASGLRFGILFLLAASLFWGCMPSRIVRKDWGLDLKAGQRRWIARTLRGMSLEEKAGQMVAFACTGRFYGEKNEEFIRLERLVRRYKIGGLILFGGEVYATAHLTNHFQRQANIPLLFASDLERGLGTQMERTVLFPPFMALGAADSEEHAYALGKITAEEGRAVGIHQTYAPVVDVNINPDNPIINTRSLGEDPKKVGRLAAAFIRGCQENGLLATAKHFPGHGDTSLDSHTVLPTISGGKTRLADVELPPFQMAVEAGVASVMVSHLHVPALDPRPNMPATLSRPILTDLLRGEMGFRGLIVTDSMRMGGLSAFSPEEAAVLAVEAGVDMLLIPPEPERAIEALAEAVRSGRLAETRIDGAVGRILAMKAALGLHKKSLVDPSALPALIGRLDHIKAAQALMEESITLVKNRGDILPLPKEGLKVGVMALSSDPGGYYAGRTFVRALQARLPETRAFYAEPTTGDVFFAQAEAEARGMDCLVLALFSRRTAGKGTVGLQERHQAFVKAASGWDIPTVVVSFGSPYLLRGFPEVDAYLCAYRYSDEAQKTAAAALFGEFPLRGRLPVSIPGLYPAGAGISLKAVSLPSGQ
jgi:beta-N-acetylhexosaminidase